MTTMVAIIFTMELGAKLKELRAERNWTQNELSKRAGIARTNLASIETGKVRNPATDTLLKLAHACNIRPEELYQAAGYVKDITLTRPRQETPEEILERLRVVISSTIPVYDEFPFHAGEPVEPRDYVALVKSRTGGRRLEGYLVKGKCLEPDITSGDIIIVDRDGQIDIGNTIAVLFKGELHLGRLRQIANELYLENNAGRVKLEDCQVSAPVIEVRRRLK